MNLICLPTSKDLTARQQVVYFLCVLLSAEAQGFESGAPVLLPNTWVLKSFSIRVVMSVTDRM